MQMQRWLDLKKMDDPSTSPDEEDEVYVAIDLTKEQYHQLRKRPLDALRITDCKIVSQPMESWSVKVEQQQLESAPGTDNAPPNGTLTSNPETTSFSTKAQASKDVDQGWNLVLNGPAMDPATSSLSFSTPFLCDENGFIGKIERIISP